MGDAVLSSEGRRSHAPGVEVAFWQEDAGGMERCVIARTGAADRRWLELADVVICPPQPTIGAALLHVCGSLKALPGSMVAAVEWNHCPIALVRDGCGVDLRTPDPRYAGSVEDYAWMCYRCLIAAP
jgi:hypothetical protein